MMIYSEKSKSGLIRRYEIIGGRRLSNYWWALVIFLGGCGFLLTGVSSYLEKNLWLLPLFLFSFNIVELFGFAPKSIEKGTELISLNNGTKIVATNFFLETKLLFFQALTPLLGDDGKEVEKSILSIPLSTLWTPAALCVYQTAQLVAPVATFFVFMSKISIEIPEIREVSTKLTDSVNKVNLSTQFISNASLSLSTPPPGGLTHPLALEPSFMMQSMEKNLSFFPQGLVLCFYGILGLCFSFHLWFTILWQIGGGFNEFNGEEKSVRIFRWGRPGKNRRIDLKYTNQSIEAIRVEITPRRALFLCVKGERNIPLTRVGEPIPLEEIEAQAAELTSFLQIPLEMGS